MNLLNQILLDQFRVDSFIQAGGMGSVYRVWDLKRNAALAMKVLHTDLAEDPLILARFQREASLLQTLAHPNIVPFYGLMQGPGFSFLLERFIDGPSLKEVLSARHGAPLPVGETLIYLKALCSALGYAHNSGVVHCDVKPANVLLDSGGSIFLTDFGIARFADTTVTTLRALGTPAYMAPEQITSQPVSPATDIYALGVLLFELLTAQKPFRGTEPVFDTLESAGQTTAERIRYAHLFLQPPDPRSLNPALPPELAQVILIALSKEPGERFRTAQALFTAACSAAGIDSLSLPERAPLSPEVLAAHHAPGTATLPPAAEVSPARAPSAAAATVAPTAAPTIAPDYSPPYPPAYPPYPYAAYPAQPAARKGFPAWGYALIGLGALALIVLAVVLGGQKAEPTPTLAPRPVTDTPVVVVITGTPPPLPITETPTAPGPVTPTFTPIVPTPALPETIVRRVGLDGVAVYANPDLNSSTLTVLPDGTRVWMSGQQYFDGVYTYAEIYFEYNGQYFPGWVFLDYLPGVPNTVVTPTWTPTTADLSNTIAYVSGPDGAWQIYLYNDNRGAWALPGQPADSGVPAWSPGHQWLAFRSDSGGSWQIYKIRPDGSELTQLTYDGQNYEPNWSPDGSQLLFVSDRDGNKEIYRMNADGSGQTRLTDNDVVDDDPSWSPYGDALVFESKRNDHMDVYWMALNNLADQRQVTSGGVYNGTPAWSPDGQHILYEREENDQTHLWLINTSDWSTSQFTFSGTLNYRPAWSADGTYVAYASDESGGFQVHIMNFTDGISRPVGSGFDPAPLW